MYLLTAIHRPCLDTDSNQPFFSKKKKEANNFEIITEKCPQTGY